MFPNTIGGALDLDNLADRVIKPVFKANGLECFSYKFCPIGDGARARAVS
jgi:hypothetical protein